MACKSAKKTGETYFSVEFEIHINYNRFDLMLHEITVIRISKIALVLWSILSMFKLFSLQDPVTLGIDVAQNISIVKVVLTSIHRAFTASSPGVAPWSCEWNCGTDAPRFAS